MKYNGGRERERERDIMTKYYIAACAYDLIHLFLKVYHSLATLFHSFVRVKLPKRSK